MANAGGGAGTGGAGGDGGEGPTPEFGALGSTISGGSYHTCAIAAEGTVKCWGNNNWAQMGDLATNPTGDEDVESALTPVVVPGVGDVQQLSCWNYLCFAVTNAGEVWSWGSGSFSTLGKDADESAPFKVASLAGVTKVDAGDRHACALLADGTVRCWGYGPLLGNGTSSGESATPVSVTGITTAVDLAVGQYHACVVLANGTVRCWGQNDWGQLGVAGGNVFAPTTPVPGVSGAVRIAAGYEHTCAIVGNGAIRCWGAGEFGQLGNGTVYQDQDPHAASAVVGVTSARAIDAGLYHTCARLEDESLACWGGSYNLGSNVLLSATPLVVPGLSEIVSFGLGTDHTCAREASGEAWCWGYGELGNLGDGVLHDQPNIYVVNPVAVLNFP